MDAIANIPPPPNPTSRDLSPADEKFLVNAVGMRNSGSICWFLSVVQALLSISALNRWLLQNEQYLATNPIAAQWAQLCTLSMKNGAELTAARSEIAAAPSKILEKLKELPNCNTKGFNLVSLQQQCAHEGLIKLVEAMCNQEVDDLFRQVMLLRNYCPVCEDFVSHRRDYRFYAPVVSTIDPVSSTPEAIADATEKFCRLLVAPPLSTIDVYKCDRCSKVVKGNLAAVYESLRVVREVIVVAFTMQQIRKSPNWYPEEFRLPRIAKRKVTHADGREELRSVEVGYFAYKIVAQIHHSGSNDSGHYWADCLRRDGIYRINDGIASISREGFRPAPSVVMVFYELSRVV